MVDSKENDKFDLGVKKLSDQPIVVGCETRFFVNIWYT